MIINIYSDIYIRVYLGFSPEYNFKFAVWQKYYSTRVQFVINKQFET